MTFIKKQSANNVRGKVQAGISASGVTLILEPEDATLFPDHPGAGGTDYFLTLEQKNIAGEIIKREIVKVTEKATNVFTIVRGAGTCPGSDSDKTQGNTSFSFDAGSDASLNVIAEVVDDIQDEVIRLDEDKANKTDTLFPEFTADVGFVAASGDAGDGLYLQKMIDEADADQKLNISEVQTTLGIYQPVYFDGVTAIDSISVKLEKVGTPAGVNFSIRPTLTGTPIVSGVIDAASISTFDVYTESFTSIVPSKGKYFLLIQPQSVFPFDYYKIGYSSQTVTGRNAIQLGFDGSFTFTTVTDKFFFAEVNGMVRDVFAKTSSDSPLTIPTDVARFAFDDYTDGDIIKPVTNGPLDKFTGLTTGTGYYYSSALGSISTTAGTNIYSVGFAVSGTKLFVDGKRMGIPITVGASPFTYTNTTGRSIIVRAKGGTVSGVLIDTVIYSVSWSGASGGITIPLLPGQTTEITYSSAPTMQYGHI